MRRQSSYSRRHYDNESIVQAERSGYATELVTSHDTVLRQHTRDLLRAISFGEIVS